MELLFFQSNKINKRVYNNVLVKKNYKMKKHISLAEKQDDCRNETNASQWLEFGEKKDINSSYCVFRHQCNIRTHSMPRLI